MENEKVTPNLSVTLNVKSVNYQNGNVMESTGKLKTVFGGAAQLIEEGLTIRGSDCGKANMEVNYNGANIGNGDKNTDVEMEIKGRLLTQDSGLVDVVSAKAVLNETETLDFAHKSEEWMKLRMENSCDAKCATTESFYTHKKIEI
jgi:hypothetical protein